MASLPGVGIVGKEGRQASLAADFSINQFSYLTKSTPSALSSDRKRNLRERSARTLDDRDDETAMDDCLLLRVLLVSVLTQSPSSLSNSNVQRPVACTSSPGTSNGSLNVRIRKRGGGLRQDAYK
jgi:hypothetical protein